ncbi:protein phosphatase 2C domain-containing protein [Streptomyces sp. NPDC057280]|uniref:protein phosphatase 2C domain-containing protein n=1 Tax=Streptomyces sp. NPDC057280 TaxID=3346081 RepID=UPI0036415F0F
MSHQGGRPTGHEDDWWGQLYDDKTEDAGPTSAPDTLDDRYESAAGTVNGDAGRAEIPAQDAGPRAAQDAGPRVRPAEDSAQPADIPAGPADIRAQAADIPAGPADILAQAAEAPAPAGGNPAWPAEIPARGAEIPAQPAHAPARGADIPERAAGGRAAGAEPAPAADPEPPPLPPSPSTPPPAPAQAVPPTSPPVPPSRSTPPSSAPAQAVPPTSPLPPSPSSTAQTAPPSPSSPPSAAPAQAAPPSPPSFPPSPPSPSPSLRAVVPQGGTGGRSGTPPARASENPAPAPPPADSEAPPTETPLRTATRLDLPALPPPAVTYLGSGPPTYEAEPTALPPANPDELDDLVADTVLDGAHYGSCTLRAASVRGDSARFRGEPRRDSLLTARFGTGDHALVLVAMATGARATPGAHRAAAEACHWIGRAVGRSHARLAEDIRAARRGDLKSGLHRLTDRSLGKLRASAAEQGIDPEEYSATLRCLLLPADTDCRTRVFFGVGAGGLFRLRDGEWQDIEPRVTDAAGEPVVGFGSLPAETPEGDRLTMDLGIPTPPSPYEPAPEPPREPFRFRASVARPGDTLLMCSSGLAEPLRGEPELCAYLTGRWSGPTAPGLAAFLADTQVRVKGYADDRTAAAVWEA